MLTRLQRIEQERLEDEEEAKQEIEKRKQDVEAEEERKFGEEEKQRQEKRKLDKERKRIEKEGGKDKQQRNVRIPDIKQHIKGEEEGAHAGLERGKNENNYTAVKTGEVTCQ